MERMILTKRGKEVAALAAVAVAITGFNRCSGDNPDKPKLSEDHTVQEIMPGGTLTDIVDNTCEDVSPPEILDGADALGKYNNLPTSYISAGNTVKIPNNICDAIKD